MSIQPIPACPKSLASASRAQLIEWYWVGHPRFQFFKGLGEGTHVLDIGAGGGGLPYWRQYNAPDRSDLRLSGIDLAEPPTRKLYEQFHVGNLDDGIPFADGSFDAAFASHVLEHVGSPEQLISEIGRCVRPGGLAYIEMPSPASKGLPRAEEFREAGWPMMISNFFDDGTHRDTFDLAALEAMAARAKLVCRQRGMIRVPYLEDALMSRGCKWKDSELLLYGYWSSTLWAQYAIFEKAAQ
jgi:SAM-dependent methyltransferase